jgi:outer membrane protein insertion porin family
MQRPLVISCAALALLFAAHSAGAQKFQPKTIQFKGVPEYSDQELLAAAGLKKGVTLTVAEMKDHFDHLKDSGVFETILYKFDGVDLVYTMTPAELYPVRLENLPLTPGKDLDDKLHDRFPLYHGKVPSEGGLLEDVRAALEEMLAAQGIKAAVTAVPFGTPGTKNVTAMNFSVASPPVRVGAIHLEGVSAELQPRVKSVADQAMGTSFDTGNTEANLVHAFDLFYEDEGYAGVKIHASRSGDPTVGTDAISVPFSVVIEEGQQYKLGAIHLPPDALITQAEIDKNLGLRNDQHVKGVTLRSFWSLIASRYKSKGYLDCTVNPHPQLDDASGTVNYTVDIDTGPVYHLAFVKFDNVSDDLRKLLMRSWQMLPGDPFDATYVGNFLIAAQKSDPVLQRTLANVKPTFDVRADPQTHEVNVLIRLEKRAPLP